RNIFFSFASRCLAHEVLEAGSGKNGDRVEGVASEIVGRDPRTGRNEHGGSRMALSPRVAQMPPSRSVLQKQDLVGLGMPVGVDFLSCGNACRKQDQMRGSSILRVDLENKGL